ncbi:acetate uptake transporter [Actinacidiphila bryophytorum]|uniref:Succinate-acetate/proton symporter SatP n=1 Tax=Actinacidiphila bryophytorum TaxID=1436133 RepID=A0A9W4H7B5_9ACTN|nr:acetate uptake transporter [Actinacidiphila bryophytorum]MBM9437540.1 acetate uptake transporter [Actinacidiphila bryophytorum]MBN6546842.1 acetate uptake transporter [Actinacidiphila bryophytorum]CAG7655999.1 putative Succinate-acetate/proton symporter SatP [Actinacidiphila bryophytorum]
MSTSASAPAIADPGPLGLAGFAATTFVLSSFNADLIDGSLLPVVLPLALFYGGLVQLLAGMWEFRKGNTFGATAFCSYGAFWLSYAAYVKFVAGTLPADTAHQATGLFLLIWAIFTVYMTVAALRTNGALLAVFVALAATFVVLTIAEFAQSTGTTKVGGWLGLITAVLAWYASFAVVTNSTWKRAVVPVFAEATSGGTPAGGPVESAH